MQLVGLAEDSAADRKARGAFFTPVELCDYISRWAIRDGTERILEPSCGDAAFLASAARRLDQLGAPTRGRLEGVELHADSAFQGWVNVAKTGHEAEITVGDFFTVPPQPRFDVVMGNPPYIRYQDFAGEARLKSRKAALRAGVALTGLASSWASFTVHAALFLRDGGRMGLVLPAELLTVNYASEVRRFLMASFARVHLVLFTERVFPGVQEEVVLVLADGYQRGPAAHCELYQVQNASDLARAAGVAHTWVPDPTTGKWTPSLLSPAALSAYTAISGSEEFGILSDWGTTSLGMVTGNNRFFALSDERVRELHLEQSDLIKLSPPGSRHLRGLEFSHAAWEELGRSGSARWLFRPTDQPSPAGLAYIAAGEATGVDAAYKCRVRSPWWRVPMLPPADLLLTYMNAESVHLCSNSAKAYALNSVHGVYLHRGLKRIGKELLPLAALNSMTLLGAETVGRAYGGGMLKLEPREASDLPVPSFDVVSAAADELRAVAPQVGLALRTSNLKKAVQLVDDALLVNHMGQSRATVKTLREERALLVARRKARGTGS